MEVVNRDKEKLRLEIENGKPVMKMEHRGTKMTFRFASEPPPLDTKKAIVNILTSQYMGRISE